MVNFFAGFALGSLVYFVARRRADKTLILALSERGAMQSQILSRRAEREQ